MASRSPEATRDGWGTDETPSATDYRDPATQPRTERERRLRARVAELERELDRSEDRLQRVIDEYETLLNEHDRPDGPIAAIGRWLRNL